MNITVSAMLIVSFSIFITIPAQATDSAREIRWANQVVNYLADGEPKWLEADGKKFLALYSPSTLRRPKGAIIFLHGRGVHPDWPQVIQPLRTQFPAEGWSTLSLQMPVLESDAIDEDYVPLFQDVPKRIQAGLEFLSKQKLNNIVLIGYNLGTNMGTTFLANYHDPRIKAFVGIGMMGKPQPVKYRPLDNVAAILRMKVPVLDIYGSQTYPAVLESVNRRAFAVAVYQESYQHSRQIKINGANHFFQGHENTLLKTIANWMNEFANPKQSHKLISRNNHVNNK